MPGFIIGGAQLGRWSGTATMSAMRGGAIIGDRALLEGLDLTIGQHACCGDDFVAGVELLLALCDDGPVYSRATGLIASEARGFMTQGAAGRIVQGPWNVPIREETAPNFDFGVSPGPAPDEAALDNPVWVDQLLNSTNMMWLNADSKNPAHVGGSPRWLGTLDGQVASGHVLAACRRRFDPETGQDRRHEPLAAI